MLNLNIYNHFKIKNSVIMKNLTIILWLTFTIIVNAQTQSINKSPLLSEGTPESVGMSMERLSRIDGMCKEAIQNGDIPGVVALVARSGKIIFYKAFGMADNQGGRSLKKDDIFRIASQSKAITATAVMMLWEEGEFKLDDTISKFIPEFKNPQVLTSFRYSDTWFYLPDDKINRLVSVQRKTDKGEWIRYPVTFYDPNYPIVGAKRYFSGGAGLCSTAKDYATFLQMYLNGGELNGIRILSRTTVHSIMSNQTGNLWGKDRGEYYGLAFAVINEKGQSLGGQGSVGTFDWGGYFNTQYFADPKEMVIGVLMKQTRGTVSDDTGWKFRLLVGQAVDD